MEEPKFMNLSPEMALYSPDGSVNEQENHIPSEVVELVKPSVLTLPYSLENTNDKEEKLSPQSVLDPIIGEVTSPRHKTPNRGIELKTKNFSSGAFYNLNIIEQNFMLLQMNSPCLLPECCSKRLTLLQHP